MASVQESNSTCPSGPSARRCVTTWRANQNATSPQRWDPSPAVVRHLECAAIGLPLARPGEMLSIRELPPNSGNRQKKTIMINLRQPHAHIRYGHGQRVFLQTMQSIASYCQHEASCTSCQFCILSTGHRKIQDTLPRVPRSPQP
jgi:hypothetical protein